MRRPNLFIVGAPKSGTTAMQYYLAQHPDIFMLSGMEPHYFGRDVRLSVFRHLTEECYLKLFSAAAGEKLVGEKSASYLASNVAATEIKSFSPEAYIIAMLRNPVDMIYSLHSEALFGGWETIPDFYTALTTEAERPVNTRASRTDAPNFSGRVYWRVAQYTEQLKRYFDVFGREKVHVIVFDDFKRDTAGVFADTLRFLDVDADFQPDLVVINPNKRNRWQLIRRPPLLARTIARSLTPTKSLRQRIRQLLNRINTSYQPRQPMDTALRAELQQQFAPEITRLGELLGRDLSHWTSPA